jgi:transcriptional regulator with XRE-family HTH domain
MELNKNTDGSHDLNKIIEDYNPYAIKHVFSKRLQGLMIRAQMTQTELATKLNLATPSTVSKWRTGTNLPRLDTLEKIGQIFDVSPAYLVTPMVTGFGASNNLDKIIKWCFMRKEVYARETHVKLMLSLMEMDEQDVHLVQKLCERLANK